MRPVLDAAYRLVQHRFVGAVAVSAVWRTVAGSGVSASGAAGVAKLLGCPVSDAEDALDALVDAHLLTGRPYRFDPIQRGYVTELLDRYGAPCPQAQVVTAHQD
jgi:hypothetical protein